jgi:3-dehydroquinate synthase
MRGGLTALSRAELDKICELETKMQVNTVHVGLPGREYDILIGAGVLDQAGARIAAFGGRKHIAIVTDENVATLHLARLQAALAQAGLTSDALILPAGEATKSWARLEQVCEWLLGQKVERRDTIVALGGGVIGDLAGFAAAILRRGVRFVQVPTSLLAQVDSSVGGKTGINSPHGKNLIGAFHQPALVLADTGLLASLPERDFLAGYGEVVKYGLLGDAGFFDWLEANATAMTGGDRAAIDHAVTRSCQMKAAIVMRDETETGDRALLNLGHTFCHALEQATGYSDRLLHGEGVAIGCALAFELSARLGLCSQESPSRIRAHLRAMGMKVDIADIAGDLPGADDLIALMGQDKKVSAGQLRFILARSIGDAFITADVPRDALHQLLVDALPRR